MHKLVAKQLARAKKASGSVDLDALITLVSAAYDEADSDRRRNERSMALMIEEVDQLNRGLEQLVDERTVELRSVRTVLEAAINNMSQGLLMFDAEARLVICNRRYLDMYELSADRVKPGCTLRELLALRHDTGFFNEDIEEYISTLVETMREGSDSTRLIELPDGRTIAILNHPMPGGGWVETHEDITERRRAEIKIAHMARHDGLTDLPNRMWLRERLGHALSAVHSGERLAVLYLDLDHFKGVNDTLGHPIGDELLKAVAGRLRRCVRDSDVIARIGGDEFAIVRTSLQDSQEASALAQRLCEVIRAPYDIDGHAVIVDTSVGISVSPDDGVDPNELLKNADMALYGAKTDGRGTHRFFEAEMDARMKARRILELSLRGALERGEFHLNYQPLLHLGRNRVSCCEALLRWRHPERGMVSPAEFIPVAEETGLTSARRLGAAQGVRRRGRVAGRHQGGGQSLPDPADEPELAARGDECPCGVTPSLASAGARNHRSGAAAKHRPHAHHAASVAGARRADLDGRFRHRLLVLELSAPFSLRQDQDRPRLHRRPPGRP